MKNSPDDKSTKCLSGILRSLLCSRSLPTHPSDQFIEPNTEKSDEQNPEIFLEANVKEPGISNPGVVARLMGLDSFPNTRLPAKDRTLGSFLRSRSVNSIDFISQFDVRKKDCHHRRVRTSVSFREVPSLSLDGNGVVLDEIRETAEYGERELLIKKRPQVNCQRGRKVTTRVACKNSEKFEEKEELNKNVQCKKMVSSVKLPLGVVGNAGFNKKDFHGKTSLSLKEKRKPVERRPILMKQVKKKQSKILSHKGPSESGIKKVHTEASVRREVSRPMCSNKTQIASSSKNNGEVKAVLKVKDERKLKHEEIFYYNYKNMLENVKEMSFDWLLKGEVLRFEDFDEICKHFGQQILEGLLNQMVDELVTLYGKKEGEFVM